MESEKTQGYVAYKKAKSSAFPEGDHKAAMNRQISMTDKHEPEITKSIHKTSTALELSVRKLLEGLNMFNGTNLTLISYVDQDK